MNLVSDSTEMTSVKENNEGLLEAKLTFIEDEILRKYGRKVEIESDEKQLESDDSEEYFNARQTKKKQDDDFDFEVWNEPVLKRKQKREVAEMETKINVCKCSGKCNKNKCTCYSMGLDCCIECGCDGDCEQDEKVKKAAS